MSVLLSVAGLTRRFGHLTALDNLDLQVTAGERRAVIGANGAGKTTLINLIAGTLRPTGGRIMLSGRDITTTSPARRARLGVGRTFQTPALLGSLTVLDNVVLGGWRHTPRRWRTAQRRALTLSAIRQLDRLGVAHTAHTPARHLAHGQRRLVELATVLVAQPRLLLLDEPAAGLAAADLPRLLDCLRDLPAQTGVLLVEHHHDVVTAIADTITVLHHGAHLATGTPQQITADPAVNQLYHRPRDAGAGQVVR